MASRIAVSDTTAGTMIRELRVTGASGRASTSLGRLFAAPGHSQRLAQSTLAPTITTPTNATATFTHCRCITTPPGLR